MTRRSQKQTVFCAFRDCPSESNAAVLNHCMRDSSFASLTLITDRDLAICFTLTCPRLNILSPPPLLCFRSIAPPWDQVFQKKHNLSNDRTTGSTNNYLRVGLSGLHWRLTTSGQFIVCWDASQQLPTLLQLLGNRTQSVWSVLSILMALNPLIPVSIVVGTN